MKSITNLLIILYLSFSIPLEAQTIPVHNWYHKGDKDHVTIANYYPSQEQLESWGYSHPTLVYEAWATRGNGMIAIYRWYHPLEKDWVTLPETYGTDEGLIKAGYKDKLFLFYAYPSPQYGTILVNLWYHKGEKDYVSLPVNFDTDKNLIMAGYEKAPTGFFYAVPNKN
jgi:hypothetical protein